MLVLIIKVILLSLVLVTASFLLQGNIGISLADEGFLWYGAIHTALGEVPLRDFQSYEPGRYYWVAAWFKIFGNSDLMSLRIATAIFQSFGLSFGLLALRRVTKSWWLLAIAGVVLLLWMYPNYYIFEPSVAMAAVYFATLLVEKPSLWRHFVAGVFVGVAAFMGLNHGLYTFLSFLLLIIFIWIKLDRNDFFRRLLAWGSGLIVGYSPTFLMLVFIPGFFDSFLEGIKFYFRAGTTNLPLPVPWFWSVSYLNLNLIQSAHAFTKGLFFFILPLFTIITIFYLLLSKRRDLKRKHLLTAATFVSLTYMHHAFSRADIEHLSASIHPLLIGLISLPAAFQLDTRKRFNVGLIIAILTATLLSVGAVSPYYLKATAPPGQYVKQNIIDDPIWMDRGIANLINRFVQINNQLIPQKEGLLLAPHWTIIYPILQRKSPLWDIYILFPETEARQKKMIEELRQKNVNWVILSDVALDGRDELRFKNTHSLIWQYFVENYEVVKISGLADNTKLMHKRVATPFHP